MNDSATGYPSIDKPWLKYYSEEAIFSEIPRCTMYEYVYNDNRDYLDRVALDYFGRQITYGELLDKIEKAASSFNQIGIGAGDVVSIISVTVPETIYILYALNKIGAVANMIDPRTDSHNIAHYIAETNSACVVVLDAALPKISPIISSETVVVVSPADSLPSIKRMLYKLKNRPAKLPTGYLSWADFVNLGKSESICPAYEPDKCAVIVHTGGTTGTPKSVMLSNDNLNAAAYQCWITGVDFKREHTWLNIMPIFIAYGVGNGLHLPLVQGAKVHLIPAFNPDEFDKLLIKHKPNHMVGVPSHYEKLIGSPKLANADLSFIIAPVSGGDAMSPDLERRVNEFFRKTNCPYDITKGYGMTEVCAAVSYCISNECNRIGSVGIPFSHTVISIFNPDTGSELTYGEIGEVCITGPNTMLGYYGDEESTNEILMKHDDGQLWVHSGDLGYMDEDGFVFLVGRIKRMIVRHDGFKVFPSQIEGVVSQNGVIVACCAVPASDDEHGYGCVPVVFVTLDGHARKEFVLEELRAMCNERLPEYAQPKEFRIIDEMPLTPLGKIDFLRLEELATMLSE